jgi:ATP-dependent DNA helicase RecG
VGDRCVEVDRAEWWTHRATLLGVDPMAAPTNHTVSDIPDSALSVVRKYLEAGGEDTENVTADVETLLTRLGVLRPHGTLSQAGTLLLTPSQSAQVTLSRLDVVGGNVIGRFEPRAGTTLIEALAAIEERLDAYNEVRPENRGFVEAGQRQLPVRAVREAVLNHLIHRDWMQPESTEVRWIDADATLEVTSPGGFTGGVTPGNVLTTRHARYPALADLFRALRLVDRQGVGVPRMYQSMIAEGHRVPLIEQIAGPRVKTTLTGEPLLPVLANVLAAVEPAPRRRDVRVAVLVDALLRRPTLTEGGAAGVLQSSIPVARLALEATETCQVNGEPLLKHHGDTWMLNSVIANDAMKGKFGTRPKSSDLLWFRHGSTDTVRRVAKEWLEEHSRVSSGDVAVLTGMSQPNVSTTLGLLASSGDVVRRGPGSGRASHFVKAE